MLLALLVDERYKLANLDILVAILGELTASILAEGLQLVFGHGIVVLFAVGSAKLTDGDSLLLDVGH